MNPYKISKTFRFEAAHHLTGLPDGHQCARIHGHSYKITVVLESDELVIPGFVADFGDLRPVKEWIDNCLDHRDLNEVLPTWFLRTGQDPGTAPTSEHMAELVYWLIKDSHLAGVKIEVVSTLAAVIVSETETSSAEYRP